MRPRIASLLSIPVLTFLTLSSSSAAGADQVDVKVLCFPKTADVPTIELLVGPEKVEEIKLQAHEFTLPTKVPRLPVWKFGKSGTDGEGNFTFTTYAEFQPADLKRQLLVFIREGPKNEDGFRIRALDPKTLRGKQYHLTNLTTGPIAGTIGGKNFKLTPGSHTTVKPEADRGKNLCFASLSYLRNGKARTFFSSNWKLRERSRVLIFIYNTSGQQSPRIHSVVDPVRPPAEANP
ncbi:hypothetical protein HAHE_27090 [Haloferula helveola]|uniref:Secreted protein n=1 Tax=Haloferula helveola TaxID=490095 RepID=A0ABM7RB87_9BACT|nr:hypothetical protein HAHE_27090 [Haloferula helveola]